MRAPDVTIAGGGPAGAAAAICLARAGVRVALLERTRRAHDKVCGEFLSPAALQELSGLGIRPEGHAITRVAFACGARCAEARLPFAARSLSRATLDETLLAHAATAGAEVQRGVTFRAQDGRGALFVATGKHDLPGRSRGDGFVGFKQHVRLSASARAALANCVALVPLRGGYLGLQPIDDETATVCLALSPARFSAVGGTWPALLDSIRRRRPVLDGWLSGVEPVQAKPLAIARVPYGFVRRRTDGPWWLGDQATVIPSFAGAGIGLALASARMAAESFLAGESAATFQARFARWAAPQVLRARILSGIMVHPTTAALALDAARHFPGLLPLVAQGLHQPGRVEPYRYAAGFPREGSVET